MCWFGLLGFGIRKLFVLFGGLVVCLFIFETAFD